MEGSIGRGSRRNLALKPLVRSKMLPITAAVLTIAVTLTAAASLWVLRVHAATPTFQLPMRGHVQIIGYLRGKGDHTIGSPDEWAVDLTSDDPEVHPIAAGTVVFADFSCLTKKAGSPCYGNVIAIDHGGGYYSIYAHLADDTYFEAVKQQLAQNNKTGVAVTAATRIGTMSDSGCTGCALHLHFAVRTTSKHLTPLHAVYDGTAVNVWEYPSAGGSAWIPGLPWPQARTNDNGWSVSLAANPTKTAEGQSVTLAAQSSQDVSPYEIDVIDQTTGQTVQACSSGTSCVAQVTQSSPTTHTYETNVEYALTFPQPTVVEIATSGAVPVTWVPIGTFVTQYHYTTADVTTSLGENGCTYDGQTHAWQDIANLVGPPDDASAVCNVTSAIGGAYLFTSIAPFAEIPSDATWTSITVDIRFHATDAFDMLNINGNVCNWSVGRSFAPANDSTLQDYTTTITPDQCSALTTQALQQGGLILHWSTDHSLSNSYTIDAIGVQVVYSAPIGL